MIFDSIIHRVAIEKGWSGDRKFSAVTADGAKYLLRISSPERLDRRKREFAQMCRVAALGIPMCQPVEFGLCNSVL